jgi:hypothetical protein
LHGVKSRKSKLETRTKFKTRIPNLRAFVDADLSRRMRAQILRPGSKRIIWRAAFSLSSTGGEGRGEEGANPFSRLPTEKNCFFEFRICFELRTSNFELLLIPASPSFELSAPPPTPSPPNPQSPL